MRKIDYFDAISSKSGLPSGTSVSLSTGLLSTSPIFLPEELKELDSRMPSSHNATLITTQIPTIPIAEPDQLTFGFRGRCSAEAPGRRRYL